MTESRHVGLFEGALQKYVTRGHQEATAEQSQCLLFFAFLWERCGDRDLDLPALRSGDGDRERLDHLGDLIFKGEMLLDFRGWCPESLLRLLSPSSLLLPFSLLLLSSFDLSLDFDIDLSFFSSSF